MKPSVNQLGRFLLRNVLDEKQAAILPSVEVAAIKEISRPATFFKEISSGYLLVMDAVMDISCDPLSMQRLLAVARDTGAGMVYSDFLCRGGKSFCPHPLNDYQEGSIRDDFNFGHFFIISVAAIKTAIQKYGAPPNDASTALYDLRLKISIDHPLIHVPEFLYTASAKKIKTTKSSGRQTETQFAYVARENFVRQRKMEKIAANYLKMIGAHLSARKTKTDRAPEAFQWKASIVIPVLNRKKTIADALKSALRQKTDFSFNIMVVDNHSTDGTTEILKKFTAEYPHIHHIIPSRRDLNIGGCWNEAILSPSCGRYIIQLDSDDLYRSPYTLQKIVDTLRKGPYAMVVGSYTLVNEKLKPVPPGLIDHREWTKQNGHNNLLRVNGMGAPRAFDTAVIRPIGFPNVSYGEDYAVALRLTREYQIGRIYESLYLCRRWTDNTDASLSVEKQNRNDYYKDKLRTLEIKARQEMNCREHSRAFPTDVKPAAGNIFTEFSGKDNKALPVLCRDLFDDQKKSWPALSTACRNLASVQTRKLLCGNYQVMMQYNPARSVSSGAAVDAASIKNRPCFLCRTNLPREQMGIFYRKKYLILCNPAPIFNWHFTVAALDHRPQEITSSFPSLLDLAADVSPDYTVLYNGPACGASAPDHLHFQMIPSDALPFLNELKKLPTIKEKDTVRYSSGNDFDRSVLVMASANADAVNDHFYGLLKGARQILPGSGEPLMNVLCAYEKNCWRLMIFLRGKHRPDAYFAQGEKRIFVSPGAIDMTGVIITPRIIDYQRLDCDTVQNIYREVSLDEETLNKIVNHL